MPQGPTFVLFFFSSPSECRGFTCISEDSSEITFLLVENYNLTAPVGSRPGREFLEPILFAGICSFPSSPSAHAGRGEEGRGRSRWAVSGSPPGRTTSSEAVTSCDWDQYLLLHSLLELNRGVFVYVLKPCIHPHLLISRRVQNNDFCLGLAHAFHHQFISRIHAINKCAVSLDKNPILPAV